MSFILDALRKSDAERQRAVTPGLSDVRYANRRGRRNLWLPILVVVLAANIVFMAVQWFRRGESPPPPAAISAVPAPATETPLPAPVVPVAPAPEAAIRPLAREAEFGEPALEPGMENEFGALAPVIVEAPEAPAGGSAPVPDIAAVGTPAQAVAADPTASQPKPGTPSRIVAGNELPTAEQLIGSGALNIPILNLDLHVYSDKPASRFVVINSRKYKEGGQLTEGPTVDSITKDGVILVNQGRRFTLSRK
jgi:general secretion pathway protein B